MADTVKPLLQVDKLSVAFGHPGEREWVVDRVSFEIGVGEKLALVGESGSGKSVTALSILRLHDGAQSEYPTGQVLFQGHDLMQVDDAHLRRVRGRDIGIIFQEPMTSLNPVFPIGTQITESLLLHQTDNRSVARRRALEMLERVGIPEPHKRLDAYPHMLSGGQRQRVMIAMALACNPKLLIADEPTTALDVTIQKQILDLLDELQREFQMAVLMITHDLNIVRSFADRICVMRGGRLVEQAGVRELFNAPKHPYTRKLINSEPPALVGDETVDVSLAPLLSARALSCHFPIRAGFFRRQVGEVKAVRGVDLELRPGETLGIVGESGSGKSTLGMCLLRLQNCRGEIEFAGQRLDVLDERAMRPLRKDVQIVFQDPYSSLSPRMTVQQIVAEGLKLHFPELTVEERDARILAVLKEVGLHGDMRWRYPHEFSGGQRQRIAIARALVLEPKLMLLDEPTSALDVSVQKQVLALLRELQQRHQLSFLFISHDLKVIRAMAHRVMVMKEGQVVEHGPTAQVFDEPEHDYTRQLLEAALVGSQLQISADGTEATSDDSDEPGAATDGEAAPEGALEAESDPESGAGAAPKSAPKKLASPKRRGKTLKSGVRPRKDAVAEDDDGE